ncbi:Dabb family protein [bacterium]|nr:Dabb family protein [bacterium]
MLAHMVYFSLKDASEAKQDELVASCHKYLTGHDGEVFYAAGTLAKDLQRPVNDKGFDVALQIVFDGKAAHDKYQDHPRHLDFIKANQPNIAKVRVFDSYVTGP